MAPRRVKEETQDDEFMLSQGSHASSDDNAALEIALAEQFMASKEKKRKEYQQKFLVASKKHVLKELSRPVEQLKATVESVYAYHSLLSSKHAIDLCKSEELVQAFIINHATEEDNIRKIWCEIIEEERKLQAFMATCISNNESARKAAEGLHVNGMSKIQTVCLEYQEIIDFVKPKPLGT